MIDHNIPVNIESAIKELKEKKKAVILAHYYQDGEIQDIADFVGDSLELSRKAQAANAELILFSGVRFMAEVAKILSPNAKVLVPDMNAGCSLEESCEPNAFAKFCEKYPDHVVVSYINCSAKVKALSDIIVTSANAERVIRAIPQDKKIIFAPDKYLGAYLQKVTGREMVLWPGTCMVHEQFSEKELVKLKVRHSDALVIAHPECPEHLLSHADYIGSTSALLKYVAANNGREFIVVTEPGIIHQMQKLALESKFHEVAAVSADGSCTHCNQCPHMRLNTLEKIYLALRDERPELTLDEETAKEAKRSLLEMLKY